MSQKAKSTNPLFEDVQDCIHLKACRRCSKIARAEGYRGGRGCYSGCRAYQNLEMFIEATDGLYSYDDCRRIIEGACRDGQSGYSPGDLLVEDYI